VAHRLQGLRKAAGLEVSDRVVASIEGPSALVKRLGAHRAWLAEEILAVELHLGEGTDIGPSATVEELALPEGTLRLAVRRA
ncbi:MAG: DUF5915 domain-containing protein, partial [Candidatus Limnocylindria bacterium]